MLESADLIEFEEFPGGYRERIVAPTLRLSNCNGKQY